MKRIYIVKGILFILLLTNWSCQKAQNIDVSYVDFPSAKSLYCYATDLDFNTIKTELQKGNFIRWDGNSPLQWEVNSESKERYELYFTSDIPNGLGVEKLKLELNEKEHAFNLAPTKGPFFEGNNVQRIKLPFVIDVSAGKNKIVISAPEKFKGENTILFRALELLPLSQKADIINKQQRAIAARSDISWFLEDGYGLMFHWTSESVLPDGSIKTYEDAVNDFDVEQFANMVEETGAGYVLFTIGHAESYCPAPIDSWEKVHPGQTTQRDLIEDLANVLNERNIKLFLYINGPLAFKIDKENTHSSLEEKLVFEENFQNILSEIGNRYKKKVAGYWFDSWYQIFEKYPDVAFEKFNTAAKIGNKERIFCLNSWIYPAVSPWQDYWAGEVGSIIDTPKKGYMKDGPVPNLPYQALLIMEPYWVQQKAEMPEPRFSPDELSKYIKDCMENGGNVTINMGIYQDGTVSEKALMVMKEVKSVLRVTK